MAPRLVIFDWSGTLSDDRRVVFAASIRMREEFGLPPLDFDAWLPTVGLTVADYFREAGISADEDDVHARYERCLHAVVEAGAAPVIYPDAEETLTYLSGRGISIAVVSSHPTQQLLREAEGYGIRDRFLRMVGNSRDKSVDIARVIRELDGEPESTLYVGDTSHDVRHAKRANARVAAITTGYHPRAQLVAERPHYLFDALSDIRAAV